MKLSPQQRSILRWLYDRTLEAEQQTAGRDSLAIWGVRWQPSKVHPDWTASRRAAVSRAIRNLERRGLVLRNSQATGNPLIGEARTTADELHVRTDHLKLTPAGRESKG